MILLDKQNIHEIELGNILFCFVAEREASNNPGQIILVNSENKWFETNYADGRLELTDLFSVFPILSQCALGAYGFGIVPEGWKYEPLSDRYHLIIHESFYDYFIYCLRGAARDSEEALASWQKCAKKVLLHPVTGDFKPVKISIYSEFGFHVIKAGDEVAQRLTINSTGRVWFTRYFADEQDPCKNRSTHTRQRIDPQKAQTLLKKITSHLTRGNSHFIAPEDSGTWKVALTEDIVALAFKFTGSLDADPSLIKFSQEFRELLTDLDPVVFGTRNF